MSEGAWIFLSHSNKDFDKVRGLRNELEERGHHPLLFFLKCLDDNSEIDELIEREIMARSWFIFCDSPNSRSSSWVRKEREIIAGLSTHTSATVDLDDPISKQLSSISELTKRASVFLSYTAADRQSAKWIEDSLRVDDFGVFSDLQRTTRGPSWQAELESTMDTVVDRGAVLVLLSRASMTSQWQRREVASAFERAEPSTGHRNIVPIFLEPRWSTLEFAPLGLRDVIASQHSFDFSTGELAENIAQVKHWLRRFEWQP